MVTPGCDIQNSTIKLCSKTKTYIDVVLVENRSGTDFFIHNHYTLYVKWVSTYNTYWREEARKFKDILINYNKYVVIVVECQL